MSRNTSQNLRRLTIGASCIFLSNACAAHNHGVGNRQTLEADSTIFKAVVQSLLPSGRASLRISPIPVRNDTIEPDAEKIHRAISTSDTEYSSTIVLARKMVLDHLGVAQVEDATRGKCPGALVPPPVTGPDPKTEFCPKQDITLAAVGYPRLDKKSGMRTVRVMKTLLTPRGSTTDIDDYTLQLSDGEWKITQKKNLVVAD